MRAVSLDYRDTLELLQWKMVTSIRLNYPLTTNIRYKTKFVNVTEGAILFNFIEFTEAYRVTFIDPDKEGYYLKFIEFIKPILHDFIKEIKYGGYTFHIILKYKGETFEKRFSILNENYESLER